MVDGVDNVAGFWRWMQGQPNLAGDVPEPWRGLASDAPVPDGLDAFVRDPRRGAGLYFQHLVETGQGAPNKGLGRARLAQMQCRITGLPASEFAIPTNGSDAIDPLDPEPKKTFANFVDAVDDDSDVTTPRRPETLGAALQRGDAIMRSESGFEFAGPSGLNRSLWIKPEWMPELQAMARQGDTTPTWESEPTARSVELSLGRNLKRTIADYVRAPNEDALQQRLRWYCLRNATRVSDLTGLPLIDLLASIRFSCWQHIPGPNLVVAGDDTHPDRWHVRIDDPWTSAFTIDGGKTFGWSERCSLDAPHSELVRRALAFAKRMTKSLGAEYAYSFELVAQDDILYALQAHRLRRRTPCDFRLEGGPKSGEIEARWVRGACLDPDEKEFRLNVGRKSPILANDGLATMDQEIIDQNNQWYHERVYDELMSRRRPAVLHPNLNPGVVWQHSPRSLLFKPGVSVAFHPSEIGQVFHHLKDSAGQRVLAGEEAPTTRVRIRSDGRRAFVRFID